MFRIDKTLVQVTDPAEIPLIPVFTFGDEQPPENAEEELTAEQTAAAHNVEATAITAREAQREAQQAQKLEEAKQKAAAIVAAAQQEAAELLLAAEEQAKAIFAQARQDAYQQGRQEGGQEFAAQQQEAAAQLQRLLAEIGAEREEFFAGAEGDIIALTMAIAEKIVKTAIREREVFEGMIKNALKQMRREGKIVVRVSEQQYHDFFDADSATFVLGDESVGVDLVSDPRLNDGDLLLESFGETVNAGVDSQLKYIALSFSRAVLSESGSDEL